MQEVINNNNVIFQWILDFAVCNGLGIYLGMITCRYFNLEVNFSNSHISTFINILI